MGFFNDLKETTKDLNNVAYTENGAKGYKTTESALLDLNYKVSSLRGKDPYVVYSEFMKAYEENKVLALKWLFYVRDIRYGLGERKIFKDIIGIMACSANPYEISHLISMIPEYGRWDDLLCLKGTSLEKDMIKLITAQLKKDIDTVALSAEKEVKMPISLLAKWMPSINSHSSKTRYYAKMFATRLGLTLGEYRKTLKHLRSYIDVTEVKMSANEWDKIDYPSVPSKANLLYANAFYKHDAERRQAYIDAVAAGKEKINSGVLYPHEIVHKMTEIARNAMFTPLDEVNPELIGEAGMSVIQTMEELWKALPDVVGEDASRVLCIRDGSGSMVGNRIPDTTIPIWAVATAMAIYFSERNHSEFHNKFITFSMNPEIVELPEGGTLYQKICECEKYNKAENTDIEAVFHLILKTAIDHKMKAEDLPTSLLIVSDMEFDNGCVRSADSRFIAPRLFEHIADEYKNYGYELPRLIFWNINSRTNTIPVKENEHGVLLISGYSVNLLKMVLDNEVDPYKALVKQLMSERYEPINTLPNIMLDKSFASANHDEKSQEILQEYLKTIGTKIEVYSKINN